MNRKSIAVLSLVFLGLGASIQHVCADWVDKTITPYGFNGSAVNGLCGRTQVGVSMPTDNAGFWSGTAHTWVDLNPVGSSKSYANGIYGDKEVGTATFFGIDHAGLWTGSSGAWIDLNPAGASVSNGNAIYCNTEVGVAILPAGQHAGLWMGTSASWVDLHPSGADASEAFAVYGNTQAGFATISGSDHAALWQGSSQSWVDLNPAGATSSYANGVFGEMEVGCATFSGVTCAGLWQGTSDSWINLNPSGADGSEIYGADDDTQVGYATLSGLDHAGLWNGSSATFTDINPSGATFSYAQAIYKAGSDVWIGGEVDGQAAIWHQGSIPVISGQIIPEDVDPDSDYYYSGLTGSIEIQSTGGDILEKYPITLSNYQYYEIITGQPDGAYVAVAKLSHWLAQAVPFTVTGGTGSVSFSLFNGDINGDNFVEDQDYSLLGRAWYSQSGDANYDVRADLNCDGRVEDLDYSILAKNWYASGDDF